MMKSDIIWILCVDVGIPNSVEVGHHLHEILTFIFFTERESTTLDRSCCYAQIIEVCFEFKLNSLPEWNLHYFVVFRINKDSCLAIIISP
jgi:hypothetical protein